MKVYVLQESNDHACEPIHGVYPSLVAAMAFLGPEHDGAWHQNDLGLPGDRPTWEFRYRRGGPFSDSYMIEEWDVDLGVRVERAVGSSLADLRDLLPGESQADAITRWDRDDRVAAPHVPVWRWASIWSVGEGPTS